jgi:hypothetical protein
VIYKLFQKERSVSNFNEILSEELHWERKHPKNKFMLEHSNLLDPMELGAITFLRFMSKRVTSRLYSCFLKFAYFDFLFEKIFSSTMSNIHKGASSCQYWHNIYLEWHIIFSMGPN